MLVEVAEVLRPKAESELICFVMSTNFLTITTTRLFLVFSVNK